MLVRGQGFEPRLVVSETTVLPLDDPRIKLYFNQSSNLAFVNMCFFTFWVLALKSCGRPYPREDLKQVQDDSCGRIVPEDRCIFRMT